MTSPQATPDRPWPGLANFTAADQEYFYGRDAEVRELSDRVRRAPLTVLYGVSGNGKSSLLGAGLIPEIESQGHTVTFLRRCYDDLANRSLVQDVIVAAGGAADIPTLWEFFHQRAGGPYALDTPVPVLILDQFEEIFIKGEDCNTTDKAADTRAAEAARDFLSQLADLVENRPPPSLRGQVEAGSSEEKRALMRRYDFQSRPVRVILALREDFLARLERWRRLMPSMMEHRVELRPLSGPQAYRAVYEPGTKRSGQPAIIPPEMAQAIVRAAGGAGPEVPLEEVSAVPPILSLLCERLNSRRLASEPVPESIAPGDFSSAEADRILGSFYDEKLRTHPKAVAHFLEDKLVSDSGFRENVTLDSALATLRGTHRIADAQARLQQLVDDRILVIEERGGVARVEFTHDTLAKLAMERRFEHQAQRRRLRMIAWGVFCLGIAALALVLSAWAFREKVRAEKETVRAQEAVAQSQAADLKKDNTLWSASRSEHERALRAFAKGEQGEGLASLISAVQWQPKNNAALAASASHAFWLDSPVWRQYSATALDFSISAMAFSSDGRLLAVASEHGLVKVIETATGRELLSRQLQESVFALSFSPDDQVLAVASGLIQTQGTVALWKLTDGKDFFEPLSFTQEVNEMAFSPDGRLLAVCGRGRTLFVFEIATRAEYTTSHFYDQVSSLSFSPDGRWLSAGDFYGNVRVMDVATRKTEWEKEFAGKLNANALSFSPDGRWLAIANTLQSRDGRIEAEVCFLELSTMTEAGRLTFKSPISSVQFSPDSRWLALATGDLAKPSEARILEVPTGRQVSSISFASQITSLDMSPDGCWLAAGSHDRTARIMEAVTGRIVRQLKFEREVSAIRFSPDGSWLAIGGGDSTLRILESSESRETALFSFPSQVLSTAISPDGQRMGVGCADHVARVVECGTHREIARVQFDDEVTSVAFSPDGRLLAAGSVDRSLKIIEVLGGKELLKQRLNGAVCAMAFSRDGRWLAAGGGTIRAQGEVGIFSTEQGEEKARIPFPDAVTSVRFHPDGNTLAVGCWDHTFRLVESNTERAKLESAFQWAVNSVSFDASGKLAAAGSSDHNVRIYETDTGRETAAAVFDDRVTSIDLSPDGRWLAGGSADHTLRIFDCVADKEVARMAMLSYVTSVCFSADGRWLMAGSGDGLVCLIDCRWLPSSDESPTEAWLEALSGYGGSRFDETGHLRLLSPMEWMEWGDSIAWSRMGREGSYSIGSSLSWHHATRHWSALPPSHRTVSPWESNRMAHEIGRELRHAEHASAVRRAVARAPWHPLSPISLARLEDDPTRQKFLAGATIHRLRTADSTLYDSSMRAGYAALCETWMKDLGLEQESLEAAKIRVALDPVDSAGIAAGSDTVVISKPAARLPSRFAGAVGSTPRRFVYIYKHAEEPGKRTWRRQGNVWTEEYPSGVVKVFQVESTGEVVGKRGTILRLRESEFRIFVPDISADKMFLLMKSGGGPWGSLGEMVEIE